MRESAYADWRARFVDFRRVPRRSTVVRTSHHPSEVLMNNKSRHLTRLSGIVATIVGMVLFTASQAAAMRPDPGTPGSTCVSEGSGTQSVLRVSENAVSVLQWVLFAVVVIAALLIGAALTHLSQRRRIRLAH
jgi:hypothetical protein